MSSKPLLLALLALLVLTSMPAMMSHSQESAQGEPAAKQQPADKSAAAIQNSTSHQSEGERVFAQNCARCHNAPDGFSSRISGTIVRHMRVRASLSQHDEKELLRFLNP